MDITSDNAAVMAGYTEEKHVISNGKELYLLVKPDTDYTENFKAFDTDQQEMIIVPSFGLVIP